jgi:predicted enzyme related to lactoylglutathione lyase
LHPTRTFLYDAKTPMKELFRFALRTTDADTARDFYATILGHRRAEIWPLHEQARARGARPHWLGHIEVEDAERAAAAFLERGATPLGPTLSTPDGGRSVILRDPGGAVLALATRSQPDPVAGADVVWRVLNTNDATRAAKNYAELFGWEMTALVDLGARGVFQQFAWHAGGESVGAIGDIAARPGVHPHWLFFFEVDVLDPSLAKARDAGGVVVEVAALPSGRRYAVCDDPQGAAFGLCERGAR